MKMLTSSYQHHLDGPYNIQRRLPDIIDGQKNISKDEKNHIVRLHNDADLCELYGTKLYNFCKGLER